MFKSTSKLCKLSDLPKNRVNSKDDYPESTNGEMFGKSCRCRAQTVLVVYVFSLC